MTSRVITGDCSTVLPGIELDSIDAIVTDPPAGIAFMGKDWDKDKGGRAAWIAWMTKIAHECLRAAKPGAHALVWALPRTSHWTATAWEDGGWEIRDRIGFLHGVGFPKNLNLGGGLGTALKPSVEDWIKLRKPFAMNFSDAFDCATIGLEALLWHYSSAKFAAKCLEGKDRASVRWLAAVWSTAWSLGKSGVTAMFNSRETAEMFWNIAWSWRAILDAVFGLKSTFTTSMGTGLTTELRTLSCFLSAIIPRDIIEGATMGSGLMCNVLDAARCSSGELSGQNSTQTHIAAKPAMLPVLSLLASVAESVSSITGMRPENFAPGFATTDPKVDDYWLLRKPLIGTVAANVAKFGTGALRIDECRIASDDKLVRPFVSRNDNLVLGVGLGAGSQSEPSGRFPAHLCHDGSAEVEAVFPETVGASGNASRFFYSAKATRADREEGLESFVSKQRDDGRDSDAPGANNPRNRGGQGRSNHHPCVKSTSLMRWLCRLITPRNGTVLDPFCGSGSTGKACAFERLSFIGIEQDAEYAAIARARIAWAEARNEPSQLSLLEQPLEE